MSNKIQPFASSRPRKTMAHYLVVATAKEMAGAVYEELMQRNDWYSLWKEKNPGCSSATLQLRFIRRTYPSLLEEARSTLAAMLARPLDEGLKSQIYEALCLDNQLLPGRRAGAKVGAHILANMKLREN